MSLKESWIYSASIKQIQEFYEGEDAFVAGYYVADRKNKTRVAELKKRITEELEYQEVPRLIKIINEVMGK